MNKILQLSLIGIVIALVAIVSSCDNKKPYTDSPIVGRWYMEQPMISNGVDYSAGWFAAHDSFAYDFEEDGTLMISGGPEPLDPVKYKFDLVGDSVLNIIPDGEHERFAEQFKVISLAADTIWLRPHDDNTDTNDYCFLVKK